MGLRELFGKLFGGCPDATAPRPDTTPKNVSSPEAYAQRREKLLAAFTYREMPPSLKSETLLAEWESAHTQAGAPLFLLFEDTLVDMLEEAVWQDAPLPDLDELFAPYIKELENDSESAPLLGVKGAKPGNVSQPLRTFHYAERTPLYLLQIPVERPWEIFRYLPVGDWNACPNAQVFTAFCKEMNEKYGAEPLLLRGDCFEMKAARRPASLEEAFALAERLYAFDEDILVEYGTVWMLADSLMKSDYWFFWWD